MRNWIYTHEKALIITISISALSGLVLVAFSPTFTYSYGTFKGWVGVACLGTALLLTLLLALSKKEGDTSASSLQDYF